MVDSTVADEVAMATGSPLQMLRLAVGIVSAVIHFILQRVLLQPAKQLQGQVVLVRDHFLSLQIILLSKLLVSRSKDLWKIDKLSSPSFSIFSFLL